jgi:sugar diacid utilization regulator/GAF domain-containing protein
MTASVGRPSRSSTGEAATPVVADGLEGLLAAPDLATALAGATTALAPIRGDVRVLVAAVDAHGGVLGSAPRGREAAWATASLRHPETAGGAGGPAGTAGSAWIAGAPAVEGVRALVIVDDPDPAPPLRERAHLVAAAVARAVAIERDRGRADEMRRLVSTVKRVAVSLELEPLLREIIVDAATLIGADSGDMLLLDEDRSVLSVVALTNFPPDMLGLEFPLGEGLSTQAMLARRPLIVSDYVHYEHRIPSLDTYDLRSVLCAPLLLRDRAIGALNVHGIHARREFSEHDADLLAAFADLAAIAIDHARRYENEQRLGRALASTNDELTRILSLQRRLSDLVVADEGLEAMVRELAARLDRPLVLHDHLWRVVAGAAPDGSEAWHALVRTRRAARSRGDAADAPAALDVALDGAALADGAVRSSPVRVGRETVAHLVVAGRAATERDRALLDTAGTGLALEFAKRLARIEVEHRLRGDAVMDLLAGAYSSEEAMIARAAHLGHDIAEPHDVLVIDVDDFERLTTEHGERTALRVKRRFFDLVHAEVVARAPGSLVSAQSDSVIVLLAVAPGTRLTPETLAVNLQGIVASALPGVTISVGIGDRTARPADYAASFRLARESLDLMHRLDRRGVVIGANQLGAYRLLLKTSSPEELRAYASRSLGPLLDPARRGSPELLATLRAFLEGGQSQRAAARACSVHVNTVVYRLQRISELLGVDLADPSAIFDLTLAFRILDVAGLEASPRR